MVVVLLGFFNFIKTMFSLKHFYENCSFLLFRGKVHFYVYIHLYILFSYTIYYVFIISIYLSSFIDFAFFQSLLFDYTLKPLNEVDEVFRSDVILPPDRTKFVPEKDILTLWANEKKMARLNSSMDELQNKCTACKLKEDSIREALSTPVLPKAEVNENIPPVVPKAEVDQNVSPAQQPPLEIKENKVPINPCQKYLDEVSKQWGKCMQHKEWSYAEFQKNMLAYRQCEIAKAAAQEAAAQEAERLAAAQKALEDLEQTKLDLRVEKMVLNQKSFGECLQNAKNGGFMSSVHNGSSSCTTIDGKDFCSASCADGKSTCTIGDGKPCTCIVQEGYQCSCRILKGVCQCTFQPVCDGIACDTSFSNNASSCKDTTPQDKRSAFTRFMSYVFIPMDCTLNCENNNSDMYFSTMIITFAVFLIRLHSY